jgi:hypothetical protein
MTKVYIVQGEHFHCPGSPLTVHATRESANRAAAAIVNDLLDWIELPQDANPETWEAALLRARTERADQWGCSLDELGEDGGDVWITEHDVEA